MRSLPARATYSRSSTARAADPRTTGKALVGSSLGNFWRWRVGDYRIVGDIQDQKITVLIVRIGHRREVYR